MTRKSPATVLGHLGDPQESLTWDQAVRSAAAICRSLVRPPRDRTGIQGEGRTVGRQVPQSSQHPAGSCCFPATSNLTMDLTKEAGHPLYSHQEAAGNLGPWHPLVKPQSSPECLCKKALLLPPPGRNRPLSLGPGRGDIQLRVPGVLSSCDTPSQYGSSGSALTCVDS